MAETAALTTAAVVTERRIEQECDPWTEGRMRGQRNAKRRAVERHEYWMQSARAAQRAFPSMSPEQIVIEVMARCQARGRAYSIGKARHGSFRTVYEYLKKSGAFDKE